VSVVKLLAPLAAAAFVAVAAPAFAQDTSDVLDDRSARRLDHMEQVLREIRAIVFQGRETGKPVVVEPADTDSRLDGLSSKVEDLQQAVTRLNGQMEESSHALDEARKEADALREENGALKDRVAQLEQKLAPPPPPAEAPGAAPPPPGGLPAATPPPAAAASGEDAAPAFAAALQAFQAHDYAAAEAGFHDFVYRYGDTPRGPEARYYLAKTLLARQAYADAAAQDVAAIRLWPKTAWAPDALVDLARALTGMGKPADACQMLGELDRRYPKAKAQVKTGEANARSDAQCPA